MRNKAPLALMEQLVMLLVFALAAALCLQGFVLSDQMSKRCEERDRAVIAAQSAAETLKAIGANGGDMGATLAEAAQLLDGIYEQGLLRVRYDENWNPVAPQADYKYLLYAQGEPVETDGLYQASVWVDVEEKGDFGATDDCPLFQVTVAWQEGNRHG